MTDTELDATYTLLCEQMTALGPDQAPLLLARFALLAMLRIDDAPALMQMIEQAAADTTATPPPANRPATRA